MIAKIIHAIEAWWRKQKYGKTIVYFTRDADCLSVALALKAGHTSGPWLLVKTNIRGNRGWMRVKEEWLFSPGGWDKNIYPPL